MDSSKELSGRVRPPNASNTELSNAWIGLMHKIRHHQHNHYQPDQHLLLLENARHEWWLSECRRLYRIMASRVVRVVLTYPSRVAVLSCISGCVMVPSVINALIAEYTTAGTISISTSHYERES